MANTQPIAEAVIKVKLDPASLDFVRNQLKGLNNASNVSGISGSGGMSGIGRAGGSIEQALATGIGARLGGGSGGKGEGGFGSQAFGQIKSRIGQGISASIRMIKEEADRQGKSFDTSDTSDTNKEKAYDIIKNAPKELQEELIRIVQITEAEKERLIIAERNEKLTAQKTRELKKQEGQLRQNLSLAKTHLDTVARTIKYMAAPIAGLGILGFNKYLQTLDAGAINLRKAIGGLTYSWNQFLARVGDTINKSYGLQKIIQNISKILDNMDEKKIKMLFDVGIALSFLFVVTKISTAVVQIARMMSTIRTAMSTFSLAGMFKGPSLAGGAAAGGAGAAAGGISLAGIGSALLKFSVIAAEVTGVILILARVFGVEGKSSAEVLINTFKILWDVLKWVGDLFIKLAQDIMSMVELIANVFITIGDGIRLLIDLAKALFSGNLFTDTFNAIKAFKEKSEGVWDNWIKNINSTGFGAKDKEAEKKKYVFGGTTTTTSFAGLNKLAQDLADNTMLMAADKMDQASDKMNAAADKLNNQWSDYGPANKSIIFNPSFATF